MFCPYISFCGCQKLPGSFVARTVHVLVAYVEAFNGECSDLCVVSSCVMILGL